MFFIPLSQVESVELVIHALRASGGEADCSTCPARKVCMKQCLSIAEAISGMVASNTLPALDPNPAPVPEPEAEASDGPRDEPPDAGSDEPEGKPDPRRHLKIVK